MKKNTIHYDELYSYLEENIKDFERVKIISRNSKKVSNIINIQIEELDANVYVESNKKISLSNGSACTSRIIEGSHVLKAMGFSDKEANECIRVSFDKNTTIQEIDMLINELVKIC